MTYRNANRPGYKKTKVGWIPEEWDVKTLKQIGQIYTGGTPSTTNPDYWDGDINWVIPSEVTQIEGPFLYSSERRITKKGLKNSSAKVIPKNSIIVCTRATIGNCVINKNPMATNQGFKSLSPYETHDVKFIYYSIVKNKNNLLRLGAGSTFLEVSRKDFERIRLAIPPLSEQKKIAEILSAWDQAIEQTQKLIGAKRRLKQGLMQQLLTGRMRFPGFGLAVEKAGELPEGWEEHRMSNVINILGGGTPARKEEHYWHGDIPWLAVGDFSDTTRYVYDSEEKITKEGLENSNTKILEKGAVIISARGTVGAIAQLAKPMAFNQTSYGLIGKEKLISNDFLFYFLKNNIQLFAGVKYGAVFDTITKDTFKYVDIKVPELIEQIKISNMLSTIDKEIDLLRNRIIFLSKQKLGLMQKLLTGEIRPKV